MRVTPADLLAKKQRAEKIVMLTAYDVAFAPVLDEAGVDVILVGDSMANVVLGMESTTEISLEEMIVHSKAVVKGSSRAMVVGDMPYCSYQIDPALAPAAAARFIDEAGCQAVKLEWFDEALSVTEAIVRRGIPVMGHIGFTPQTADRLEGVVQGKDAAAAKRLIEQAKALEAAGCFSVVLECVPWQVAALITERMKVPTIGIGAGAACDGQVLVLHDLLGLFQRFTPKFVRRYRDLRAEALSAIASYCSDVRGGAFPSEAERFAMREEEYVKLREGLGL